MMSLDVIAILPHPFLFEGVYFMYRILSMEDLGLPIAFNSAFLERSVPPAAKSAFHQEQQSQVLPPLQPGQQVLIAAADQADTLTNTATASRVAFGMKPDVFGRPSAPNKKAEREGPL